MAQRKVTKKQLKLLQDYAQTLEAAAADAFAALWYFERDSLKGANWSYVSVQKAKRALTLAEKCSIIPKYTNDGRVVEE